MQGRTRLWKVMLVVAGGGMLLQTGGLGGCWTWGAEATLSAVNWCQVFDCQRATVLGNIFPLCGDPLNADDDILLDCPPPSFYDPTLTDDDTNGTGTTQ